MLAKRKTTTTVHFYDNNSRLLALSKDKGHHYAPEFSGKNNILRSVKEWASEAGLINTTDHVVFL